MCGIIARVGRGDSVDTLLTGLENLEYRGYDSAGVAVQNGHGIKIHKQSGQVSELKHDLRHKSPKGNVGIGHTRWSTHGPPTDENAHPHTTSTTDVAVVHNGVIENYDELREELKAKGREFTSDTDTEVIPHLVEEHLEEVGDSEVAFRRAVRELEGSYAIAALVDDEDVVYAARQGSPLVFGLDENDEGDDEYFLASDVPAFLEYTDQVMFLEDGDVAVVRPDGVELTDLDGNAVNREIETIDWDPEETGKGRYDHYMLKEIDTQPTALSNTIDGRIDPDEGAVDLEDFPEGTFEDVRDVQLVACGTSYHAALYGGQLLKQAGVRTEVHRANEYELSSGPVDDGTLVIAVTQSGETADTLAALRRAKRKGAKTVTVTNVVGSTAAREADEALFIRAGPEIGVAATKTFSSQAVSLSLLAQRLADDVPTAQPRDDAAEFLSELRALPDGIRTVLDRHGADDLARRYRDSDAYFFIGRGLGNSVAKEGALKFKEITYEHAEGFASGELKHGPLALVTPDTPVFAVFTGDEEQDRKTRKNAEEAQARGAPLVVVAPEDHDAAKIADDHLVVPETHPVWAGLLANVQLQLVAYYAADQLSRPIDKPRNLAKSVTVE
ncbi:MULTISPECIES: glutamine--fructose-6-phosphate transaminase (isomerizing) [Halorussus]|uniref:glutamine--fructose-6-phosphate transaminase (isomerizing) n=1 Tax=Halorussus TaxID=1070314 RepID=UPI00209F4843|nr:glutamine--fructose-6-phosphate transaminase (isomerizing) [Halorussus vallis]USZ78250.1 glutamine--fructose-6-phosphate transaminase (isomerizing) [Halorussus vallis]